MSGQQSWPEGAAAAEWQTHWPLVMASMLGFMMIGVLNFSLGGFMRPLKASFGWTMSDVTAGLPIYAATSVVCQPLVGRLIDLWGPRRIGLTGIVLTGCAIALFATASGSLTDWLALWLVYSLAAQLVLTPVWSSAVASEFEAGRGLALATTLSGSGLCGFIVPVVSTAVIDQFGWQAAFPILGLGATGLLLLVTFFFFRSRRDRIKSDASAEEGAIREVTGVPASEALRNPTFYKLSGAIIASYTLAMAISIHNIPILNSVGLTRPQAAWITAFFGLSAVAGKFLSGLMVTRIAGHILTAGMLLLPVASCLLLLMPEPSLAACFVAVSLFGISAGAQLQMLVYLTTRHFGLLAFGSIFGFIGSAMTIASAAGPVAASRLFDISGDYHLLLIIGIPLSAFSAMVMLWVGDYPEVRAARALAKQSA